MVKNFYAVLPCEDISPIEKGGGISCHVSLQKKSVHPKIGSHGLFGKGLVHDPPTFIKTNPIRTKG